MNNQVSNSGSKAQVVYFSDLDGLRFFSFLAVFLFHSFFTTDLALKDSTEFRFFDTFLFANGNLGVNFFFVLSGFLITFLLLTEKEHTNRINIPHFYLRRAFRIWPLFYLMVFFGFVIFPKIKLMLGQIPAETADFRYYLVFLNNFDFIKSGLPDASMLGVLWSIAVEEQFYFVWPVLISLISERRLPMLLLAVIIGSLVFRFYNNNYLSHEYSTFSVMSDLAVGGLGAWLFKRGHPILNWFRSLSIAAIILLYSLVIVTLLFREHLVNSPFSVFERLLISVLFLSVIFEQNLSEKSLFKLSDFPIVSYLGRISYGLYCYHFIGILITIQLSNFIGIKDSFFSVIVLETLVSLAITIAIAMLSFRFFEKPFLRMKENFAYKSER